MFRTHVAEEGAKEHWPWLTAKQQAAFVASVQRVLDDAESTPERAHEDWLRAKQAQGYVHGPTDDTTFTLQQEGPHMVRVPRAPTHAALLPWAELTGTQRAAALIFHATIVGLRETRGVADLSKGTGK